MGCAVVAAFSAGNLGGVAEVSSVATTPERA